MRIPIIPLLILVLSATLATASAQRVTVMNFDGMSVAQVLDFYQHATEQKLVVSSNVGQVKATITLKLEADLKNYSSKDVATGIERALLKQAGVVVTHLDNKQVSVTYNDALPITPVKKTP